MTTIRVACPHCQTPVKAAVTSAGWTCPACAKTIKSPAALAADGRLAACACCGCEQLYRCKDFPQWLGMSLLTVACVVFFFFAIRYQYAIAWTVLLGSAALDGLVYLIVGDAVVCYRCGGRHVGVPSRGFDPFDLTIAEKYRQERIRKEQMPVG